MDGRQLGSMIMFIVGFLLIYAFMRMGYALARPTVQKVSPTIAGAVDFVLIK